jgi:hypothetical protein
MTSFIIYTLHQSNQERLDEQDIYHEQRGDKCLQKKSKSKRQWPILGTVQPVFVWTQENHNKSKPGYRSLGLILNPGPPEYESSVLISLPRRLIIVILMVLL